MRPQQSRELARDHHMAFLQKSVETERTGGGPTKAFLEPLPDEACRNLAILGTECCRSGPFRRHRLFARGVRPPPAGIHADEGNILVVQSRRHYAFSTPHPPSQ